MYCALSARPTLSADLSPSTGCYKLILLTLYGGPAAAVRQCNLNNIHFYYYYYYSQLQDRVYGTTVHSIYVMLYLLIGVLLAAEDALVLLRTTASYMVTVAFRAHYLLTYLS